MPITMYKDRGYSQTPSYKTEEKKITLIEAFKLGALGVMAALDIYNGSPKEVQNILNDACQASFGQNFKALNTDEQKNIFDMFIIALENAEVGTHLETQSESTTATPQEELKDETSNDTPQSEELSINTNATPKAKKWWHIRR